MLKYCKLFGILFVSCLLSACSDKKDEPKDPADEYPYNKDENGQYIKERLILIYAIAANNLEPNLGYDMQEILDIANEKGGLNLKNNSVLVYSVDNTGVCTLKELKETRKDVYAFQTVQEFTELPLSTDPKRIVEVIDYVGTNYDFERYGLVLWSHADGWLPWFTGSNPGALEDKRKSFGWDNYHGATYKTNITALAESIPEGMFDFIWFDCCYMANIETIYELKEKTNHIVGSVLEIASDGMPYNLTMPYLLRETSDLEGAAWQFFNYYDRNFIPVSVSIMDADLLDGLAEAASVVFATGIQPSQATLTSLQTYQRNLSEKFYDMGQLLRSYSGVDQETEMMLDQAFGKAVIYKLISDFDFNHRPINTKNYSGLSMHHFVDNGSSNNEFYKTLEWYKATRLPQEDKVTDREDAADR